MIQTENLTKRFPISTAGLFKVAEQAGQGSLDRGTFWFTAVDGLNLHTGEGEILALLGPNGAGKTTSIRMLASILRPTEGRAWVAGYDTVRQAREVRQVVGLLTEFPGLYLRMRASDYLDFFGELHGLNRRLRTERGQALMARFGMADALPQRLGEYSKGMRQKLALVRAMLHDPPLLLLDEPTSAMDPYSARQVRDAILDLRRDRRTILLCTHNLNEAEELADRIAIIRRGKIIALGTPDELKHQLLGPPLLELRLAHAVDGYLADAEGLIEIQTQGDTWLRYRTADPTATNPLLLQRLGAAGARVLTLSPVPQSLEEVYLRIVGDGAPPEEARADGR